MSFRAVILIALALVLGSVGKAEAAPMMTALSTVRSNATAIVIGTMDPNALAIDVDTVVRGSIPLGRKTLKSSLTGSSYASGRVVAFLDKDDRFQWVGHVVGGSSIETGVLLLSGFFDFNAHIVSPGTMTLAQLKTFLATGTFTQRFSARIMVEDGHGQFVPSGQSLAFDYDPFTRKISNAPTFTCLDQLSTFGLDWGSVRLMFGDSSCPHAGQKSRRLDLVGAPTGVNAKGEITLDVSATSPFLDATDLPVYLKDGSIVDVKRFLHVKLSDGTTWQWELGEGLIDPQGQLHKAGRMSSSATTTGNVTTATIEYEFDGRLVTLKNPIPDSMTSGGGAGLIVMAGAKSYDACTFHDPGKPDRACTITRGTSKIVR